MLDAQGYPNANIEFGPYRLEFYDAEIKGDEIICKTKISKKPKA